MKDRRNQKLRFIHTSIRKQYSLLMVLCMIVSVLGHIPVAAKTDLLSEATFLYVATDGSNENNGSKESPFATLEAAIIAARKYEGTVVINMRGGRYPLEHMMELTAEDTDLVIRSYPGEEAKIGNAVEIPLSDMEFVTDPDILNRIIEEEARGQIRHVNLSRYGISDFGEMRINGSEFSSGQNGYPPRLTYQGEYMTIAEYPNTRDLQNEFIRIMEYIDTWVTKRELGNMHQMSYRVAEYDPTAEPDGDNRRWVVFDRYQKWTEADDIWVDGLIGTTYADSVGPLINITEDGVFTSYAGAYDPRYDARIKFIHLLEEIDIPGEYYLDHETGDLYVYAPEGMKEDEVFEFVNYDQTFMTINGSKNIAFENLQFSGTSATMFQISNSDGIVFDACDISNAGNYAIDCQYCYNIVVKNSYLHDLNAGGIRLLDCGDRQNLISGNCVITNCEIARYAQYRNCYVPAVETKRDVGTVISHNIIHDSPHEGIQIFGNDIVIEYNEIYDLGYLTYDAGAIYSGRCYNTWGNIVRYNYFHDIRDDFNSIYWDDLSSGQQTYGNIFYRAGQAIACNGGRSNTFENNLVIESGAGGMNDAGLTWCPPQRSLDAGNDVDWHTDLWKEKYPALLEIENDDPGMPKYNVVRNNFLYNCEGDFNLYQNVIRTGTYEGTVYLDTGGQSFNEFFEGDYTRISDYIKGFDTSHWKAIGLYEYTAEDVWTEKTEVEYLPLTADELKLLVKEKAPKVDLPKPWKPQEIKVETVPEVVNSENPNAPVSLFIKALASGTRKQGIASIEMLDGYVNIVPEKGTALYYPFENVTGARYVAVKYRTATAEGMSIRIALGSEGAAPADESSVLSQEVIADGEWHYAVFDTKTLSDAGIYDGSTVAYFRFALAGSGADGNTLPKGADMDVACIAFFDDTEKIEKYDLTKVPVSLFDAEALCVTTGMGNITSMTVIDNYLNIVPKTYIPHYKPFANVSGSRYLVVKYRTSTAIDMLMQIHVTTGAAPSSYQAMLDQKVIADGEWHLAIFDLQPLIEKGLYDGYRVSYFRFDPIVTDLVLNEDGSFKEDANGNYMRQEKPENAEVDIMYIGFFRSEEAAKEYDLSSDRKE